MSQRRAFIIFIAAAGVLAAALACSLPALVQQFEPTPTPARLITATPASGDIIIPPTVARTATAARPTATGESWSPPTTTPAAGESTASQEAAVVTATPAGPAKVVIRDADIQQSIEAGVTEGSGLEADNLQIRFTGGKTRLTADRVAYGLVQVNNLVLVGQLVASDGQLKFNTDSVSPGGLVGALIPTIVNQAFQKYTSQYYVEDVQTDEGQIVLTVR